VHVDLADVHDGRDDDALRVLGAAQQRRAAGRRRLLLRGAGWRLERCETDDDGDEYRVARCGQGTTVTPGASKTPFWSTST
jgi:hypothetical protein